MAAKKKRSRVKDYAAYLLVRVLVCSIQTLSWRAALALARGLAWLLHRVDRRHRLVALDNLRHAFPALDEASRERLVRASYLHLTTMIVEMVRLPRVLHHSNHEHYIHLANPDDMKRLLALGEKRPLLGLMGHFGNWEILAYSTAMNGFLGGIVVRRLDNPYLDRFLGHFRRNSGQIPLDKTADYARILSFLANGTNVAMVADQDAGPRGLFVNHFGRPASTHKSIALLSLEYGAPIVVMGAARVGQPMRYIVYVEDIILPEEYSGVTDATRAITQRYSDALERIVRRHPEQYFWQHRRWKSQPAVRARKAA